MSGAGKVVCVTGASGFVASWLVKLLLEHGYTVKASVRNPNDQNKTRKDLICLKLIYWKKDLLILLLMAVMVFFIRLPLQFSQRMSHRYCPYSRNFDNNMFSSNFHKHMLVDKKPNRYTDKKIRLYYADILVEKVRFLGKYANESCILSH